VGKSHAIQALGHQACRLRRYLQPDLLILDDFAMKEFSLQQAEDIYELIAERSLAQGGEQGDSLSLRFPPTL
jgi:DNA replication protein DnaC